MIYNQIVTWTAFAILAMYRGLNTSRSSEKTKKWRQDFCTKCAGSKYSPSPHLINENQYELNCRGEKTFPLIPVVTKPGWQLQIQSKKTFQRYSFRKNLTDVTLVWEVGQQWKKHTKCSYQGPFQLVSGIRLYSAHLRQLKTNLPPMSRSTTKICSSKW